MDLRQVKERPKLDKISLSNRQSKNTATTAEGTTECHVVRKVRDSFSFIDDLMSPDRK